MGTIEGGGNIITDGLVLYLDAANPKSYISGSTIWTDLSRRGNNGVLINGPTFNSTNGGSIVFDGTNDYNTVGNLYNDVIAGIGKQFTTSCVFFTTISSNQMLYGKYSDGATGENGREYAVLVRDLGTGFKVDVVFSTILNRGIDVNIVRSSTLLTLNTINTIDVTYDDTQTTSLNKVNIYINGVLSDKTIPAIGVLGPIASGPASFSLGASVASNGSIAYPYNGNIYSFKLYNKLLSSTEIIQNYNMTKSRFGL
jgi:hypothetical protein